MQYIKKLTITSICKTTNDYGRYWNLVAVTTIIQYGFDVRFIIWQRYEGRPFINKTDNNKILNKYLLITLLYIIN